MREDVVDALVSVLVAAEPALARSVIREVVDGVIVKEPQGQRMLALLERDPGMLTPGAVGIPPDLGRLLLGLTRVGAVTLRAPVCAHCARAVALPANDAAGRICDPCRLRRDRRRVGCRECGQQRTRHATVGGADYCRACWTALVPTADTRLAGFVRAQVPGVSPETAPAALSLGSDRRLRLALECEAFGAAWVTAPAQATVLFAGFYDLLRTLGAELPPRACGHCGRVTKLTGRLDGRICCRRCYRAGHLEPCDGCGTTASLEVRRPDGTRLCQACTNRLDQSWGVCIGCDARRLIASRTAEGPMCSRCRSLPGPDTCTLCAATAACRFPGTAKAICLPCYTATRVDVCTRCGREGECTFAGTENALCRDCGSSPEPCPGCGRVSILDRRDADGARVCWACAPAIIETCIDCGRVARVNARTPDGPICQRCARTSPLMFRDCERCGTRDRLRERRWCVRCYADDKIRNLLPGDLVADSPGLTELRDRCLVADPVRTLHAFRRGTTTTKLRAALHSREPLSHDLIDRLGSPFQTAPVRSLLVDQGLLPPRDELLVGFERWCAQAATTITDLGHRRAFEGFVRWRPLRELRQQGRPASPGQCAGRRDELRQVLGLLEWLTARSERLADLDQARLDLWLTSGTPRKRRVGNFLRWAHHNRHCPRLRSPTGQTSARVPTGQTTRQRLELLERLLREETADPRTRLAGVLVVMFGIQVVRLRALRVTDIIEDAAGRVAIRLGPDPLDLPGAIGQLALVARDRRDAPRLLSDDPEAEWLFPGQRHGTALSIDALTDRLNVLGVQVRAARTGALVALAQEMPAPVIARLIGLNATSVTAWAATTAASNARYTGMLV